MKFDKKKIMSLNKLNISHSKIQPLIHISVWLIFFMIPFLFLNQTENIFSFKMLERICRLSFFISVFYINYLILTPKLLFESKYFTYFLSLTLLVVVATFFWFLIAEKLFISNHNPPFFDEFPKNINRRQNHRNFMIVNQIFITALVCGLASIIRISQKWIKENQKQKEIEKELLNSKLEFLKHQISPHFFLNTLNNIYSLTEINVEDARKAIHKLSKMMRYLLYDSENGQTTINQEIIFINSYIELMKLRFDENVKIIFEFEILNENKNIPPLLFISFIENAFKHGISYENKSFIKIEITQNANFLEFCCSNSNHIKNNLSLEKDSGVGLENVKSRLNLIYKSNYFLDIYEKKNVYTVKLKIPLL